MNKVWSTKKYYYLLRSTLHKIQKFSKYLPILRAFWYSLRENLFFQFHTNSQ